MTRNEFIWKIEHGDDIMFDVAGRHYTIVTWPDEGIRIVEQNTNSDGIIYPSANELVEKFTVGSTPLAELCDKIVITSYTFVQ